MYRSVNDPKRRSPYDLIKHFPPPYPVLQFSNPEIEQEVRLVLTAKVKESQDPSSDNYTKFFPKPYPAHRLLQEVERMIGPPLSDVTV